MSPSEQSNPGIMVSAIFSTARGMASHLHTIPAGAKVNTDEWLEVCAHYLGPQLMTAGYFILILDQAPSHCSKRSLEWYKTYWEDPGHGRVLFQCAQSPDVSPMDFWLWNEIKRETKDVGNLIELRAENLPELIVPTIRARAYRAYHPADVPRSLEDDCCNSCRAVSDFLCRSILVMPAV